MTNVTKQPIWGDDDGGVTSYMCRIDFDYELGNAPCTKLYPSVESLKEAHPCADDCGIVKVSVRALDEIGGPSHEGKLGWMEHIEFHCELGGAKTGNGVYSSEKRVREERPYSKKYGVVPVEVTLVDVIQEPSYSTAEYLRKREKSMSIKTHLMVSHLAHDTAAMIREWQETFNNPTLEASDECQAEYLLEKCRAIEIEGERGECCETKLHRLMGYVHGVMVALNICGVDRVRSMVQEAKKNYSEEEDLDLSDHCDEGNVFFLDIGGEG